MNRQTNKPDPEGYIPANDDPLWSQSFYFNFYDEKTKTGGSFRIGALENAAESNNWIAIFRDGKPLFTRVNMNLPYTSSRMTGGVSVGGMTIRAVEPLKKASIKFESTDFQLDLVWSEEMPLQDAVELTDASSESLSNQWSYIHLEGVCQVEGIIRHRKDEIKIHCKGFRDIAAGPRNWDSVSYYRVAWPIFDNGVAMALVKAVSLDGSINYLKMLNDGSGWIGIKEIQDKNYYEEDEITLKRMEWKVIDDNDRVWKFSAKKLYRCFFYFDTFMQSAHMMEYTLEDGAKGYGLGECGFSSPWPGNAECDQ